MFWPVILLLGALYVFVYVLLDRIRELERTQRVHELRIKALIDLLPPDIDRAAFAEAMERVRYMLPERLRA